MTVSYTAEVATCSRFGCFYKILARWRASIYKLIWLDLLCFLLAYYAMAMIYRLVLEENGKRIFENTALYCQHYGTLIPLSFVLGFYVSIVVDRWWNQYISVPWPDPLAVYVSALIRGNDDHGRLMRRTVMRYTCLSLTIVLTMISPTIKRRFPTLDKLVEAGLMNENEMHIMQAIEEKVPKHPKHWMPIMWAASIVNRARREGRIWDDFSHKTIIDELNKFRSYCHVLIHYDTISVPLVYTQVVTLAVYTYFLAAIMGHQWIDRTDKNGYTNIINYYFPLFSTLEFFFFMGWLKVAESLICPFGDNDDDFELNWLIDRNLQVSYLIVDEMHNDHPQLVRDQYWDEVFPNELPYQSDMQREEHPEPSTAKFDKQQPKEERDISETSSFQDMETPRLVRLRFAPSEYSLHTVDIDLETEKVGEEDFSDHSDDKDDFDLLIQERERERLERQLQHTAMTMELFRNEATGGPEDDIRSGSHTNI